MKKYKAILDNIKELCYKGKKPNWVNISILGFIGIIILITINTILTNLIPILIIGVISGLCYLKIKQRKVSES